MLKSDYLWRNQTFLLLDHILNSGCQTRIFSEMKLFTVNFELCIWRIWNGTSWYNLISLPSRKRTFFKAFHIDKNPISAGNYCPTGHTLEMVRFLRGSFSIVPPHRRYSKKLLIFRKTGDSIQFENICWTLIY